MRFKLVLIVIVLLLSGCGYFSSGTWDDDPDNWQRAFNSQKPSDLVVSHSRYTRFPHWSYEFVYYFEIEKNEQLLTRLFTENSLIQLTGNEAANSKNVLSGNAPDWFLPLSIEKYDVWKYRENPESNFRLFIENDSGAIYLTDYLN